MIVILDSFDMKQESSGRTIVRRWDVVKRSASRSEFTAAAAGNERLSLRWRTAGYHSSLSYLSIITLHYTGTLDVECRAEYGCPGVHGTVITTTYPQCGVNIKRLSINHWLQHWQCQFHRTIQLAIETEVVKSSNFRDQRGTDNQHRRLPAEFGAPEQRIWDIPRQHELTSSLRLADKWHWHCSWSTRTIQTSQSTEAADAVKSRQAKSKQLVQ